MTRTSLLLTFAMLVLYIPVRAQTLQTVTKNGNTTTENITIDNSNVADAFSFLRIKRLNSANATKSFVSLANNKIFGQVTWQPDSSVTASYALNIGANSLAYYNNGTSETIWRSGNMGAGSGLNADLLDGYHGSSYLRTDVVTVTDMNTYPYSAAGLYLNKFYRPVNGVPNNNYATYFYLGYLTGDSTWAGMMAMGTNNGDLYTKRKVAGNWETSWRTIWDSNNFNPDNYLQLSGGAIAGDLSIGSTAAQKDLNVNGNIKARKVKVTVSEWPDYVFTPGYELLSLSSLEKFIQQHNHLPEVASAGDIAQEGLDVAENGKILMKKVEELTLYIIQQDKALESQKQLNQQLLKRLDDLEKKISE